MKSVRERFESKYMPVTESGCWIWTDNVVNGYGQMGAPGYSPRAHRLSWQLNRGPIPDGMCVCHRCDVRCCVNPSHLFLGDRADNRADCMKKNRQARGVKQGQAKLTMEQVREIRALSAAGGTTRALGEMFGVSNVTVNEIARNLRYKE